MKKRLKLNELEINSFVSLNLTQNLSELKGGATVFIGQNCSGSYAAYAVAEIRDGDARDDNEEE